MRGRIAGRQKSAISFTSRSDEPRLFGGPHMDYRPAPSTVSRGSVATFVRSLSVSDGSCVSCHFGGEERGHHDRPVGLPPVHPQRGLVRATVPASALPVELRSKAHENV